MYLLVCVRYTLLVKIKDYLVLSKVMSITPYGYVINTKK